MQRKILIVNGSRGGAGGNTAALAGRIAEALGARAEVRWLHLAEETGFREEPLAWADGFVFATGTYWDSWGSPLQKFLEDATDTEATPLWTGKPAAALVTMHSVGGKAVLSRLLGVLNTLGCRIPPFGGFVYSLVNQLALEVDSEFREDLWRPDDLEIVAHNLLESFVAAPAFRAWPVDRADAGRRWISH